MHEITEKQRRQERGEPEPLSPYRREQARLFCIGYTMAEIGEALHITPDSAKSAIRDIKITWNNNGESGMSRRDFYARAQQEGIIP